MAGEVVVDALPYYDHGYDDPGVREAVSLRFMDNTTCKIKNPARNLDRMKE